MARWKWTTEFGDMMEPKEPEEDRFQACDPCGKLVNLEDYSLEKCVECGCEICQDCEGPPIIYVSGRREIRCVSCDPANSEPDPDEAYDRLKAALERGTERLKESNQPTLGEAFKGFGEAFELLDRVEVKHVCADDPSQHVFAHLNKISKCCD